MMLGRKLSHPRCKRSRGDPGVMSVVHIFGHREVAAKDLSTDRDSKAQPSESNDNKTCEVVELVIKTKLAHGVAPKPFYRELEAIMIMVALIFRAPK